MAAILGLALVVVLAAGPSSASATLYRGSARKLTFVFSTRGDKVVRADISGVLKCKEGEGARRISHARFERHLASAKDPLRLDRNGRLSLVERPAIQTEEEEIVQALLLHVGRRQIEGSYEYRYGEFSSEPSHTCQTGTYPFGHPSVRFHARIVTR